MCVGPIWEANYVWTCLFQMGTTEYRLNEVAIWFFSRKSGAQAFVRGIPNPLRGCFPGEIHVFSKQHNEFTWAGTVVSTACGKRVEPEFQFGSTRFQLPIRGAIVINSPDS